MVFLTHKERSKAYFEKTKEVPTMPTPSRPRLTLEPLQVQRLSPIARMTAFAETNGDIPLYSLHRIANLLDKEPPGIEPEMRSLLLATCLEEGEHYRAATGNEWQCLTSKHYLLALAAFAEALDNTIEAICRTEPDARPAMEQQKQSALEEVGRWFDAKFPRLIYDLRHRVPWVIYQRLGNDLRWLDTLEPDLDQPIGEFILAVAQGQRIVTDDATDAWQRMGGTLFIPRRQRKGRS